MFIYDIVYVFLSSSIGNYRLKYIKVSKMLHHISLQIIYRYNIILLYVRKVTKVCFCSVDTVFYIFSLYGFRNPSISNLLTETP